MLIYKAVGVGVVHPQPLPAGIGIGGGWWPVVGARAGPREQVGEEGICRENNKLNCS